MLHANSYFHLIFTHVRIRLKKKPIYFISESPNGRHKINNSAKTNIIRLAWREDKQTESKLM